MTHGHSIAYYLWFFFRKDLSVLHLFCEACFITNLCLNTLKAGTVLNKMGKMSRIKGFALKHKLEMTGAISKSMGALGTCFQPFYYTV